MLVTVCTVCRKQPPAEGRRRCAPCGVRALATETARRLRLRAAGLCIGCGRVPPTTGCSRCEACILMRKLSVARLVDRKELRGECKLCPRPRVFGDLCDVCHTKTLTKNPKRVHYCSGCDEPGHNVRTCPHLSARSEAP